MAFVISLFMSVLMPILAFSADVTCDDTIYRPEPSVDYQSGVDARGQAVAPADLPGSAGAQAKDFAVPLTMGVPVDGYLNKSRKRAAEEQAKKQQENPSQPAPKPVDVNAYNADLSDTRVWPVQGTVTAKGVEFEGIPQVAGPCPGPTKEDAEKVAKPAPTRHNDPFSTPIR